MRQRRFTLVQSRALAALSHAPLKPFGRGDRWAATRERAGKFRTRIIFSGATIERLRCAGFAAYRGKQHPAVIITRRGRTAVRSLARMCIKCGCTDARACNGGCHWVSTDICSGCV